jgi:hypothetical protein
MNTDVHGLIVFISFAKEKMFFKSVFIRENLCPKKSFYDGIHSIILSVIRRVPPWLNTAGSVA